MKTKLFTVNYKGPYKEVSVEDLRSKFEFNFDTKNSSIFVVKTELPAFVSIVKRILMYVVILCAISFFLIVSLNFGVGYFGNFNFFNLMVFSQFIIAFFFLMNSAILFLYCLNTYFCLKD